MQNQGTTEKNQRNRHAVWNLRDELYLTGLVKHRWTARRNKK